MDVQKINWLRAWQRNAAGLLIALLAVAGLPPQSAAAFGDSGGLSPVAAADAKPAPGPGAPAAAPAKPASGPAAPVAAPAKPAPGPASPTTIGYQVGGFFVQPSVDLLRRLGIVIGDPSGDMRLSETMTRAELAKIAVAAAGQTPAARKAEDGPLAFADVKGHWARGYVAVARELGIVGGYADGTFRPGQPVTNAEALTMLLRACGQRPAGSWPQAYFTAAANAGVLTAALERALPPNAPATRGAVFLVLDRAMSRVPNTVGRTLLQGLQGAAGLQVKVVAQGAEQGSTSLPVANLVVTAPGAVLVQVNGRPVWPKGGVYTLKVDLQPGSNLFYVLVADDRGNRVAQRVELVRK